MTQPHEPNESLQAALRVLLSEVSDRALAEIRQRSLRLCLEPAVEEVATLLVRDLPFVLKQAELWQAGSERKDQLIDTLQDEHQSLELAVRALQTAVNQQQTELGTLRARLDRVLTHRTDLLVALSTILGATVEQALRPENRRIYAQALESIRTVVNEHTTEKQAGEGQAGSQ
jgi:hypothetical protein